MAAADIAPSLGESSWGMNLTDYTAERRTSSGFLSNASATDITFAILAVIVSLLCFEQIVYRRRKGGLPGPTWTIPVIGKFADSLRPSLEKYQEGWNSGELSVARSQLPVHKPSTWVRIGKLIIRIYLQIQESIYRRHFTQWLKDAGQGPKPFMLPFRNLNMETSLRVFCGDYISEKGAQEISDHYWLITVALELVNFPFAFPGTKVYKAIQARKMAMRWFEHTAAQSKKRMAAGEEVTCLTDAWVRGMLDARENRTNEDLQDDQRKVLLRDFSDREIGMVLLSFLFASQDAMSSGVTYLFQHLADHPEVLRKLREEQYALRGNDVESPLTLELLEKMEYTRAVVRESMRLKPPVIMVPYKTLRPFPISKDYVVPKGAMVIPSFWNSLHDPEAYPSPDEFKPERWLQGAGSPAQSHPKNYLVFGSGPHNCIGKDYAVQHLMAVIGTASVLLNWKHHVTDRSEKVLVIATIYPQDGALLSFSERAPPAEGATPEEAAAAA